MAFRTCLTLGAVYTAGMLYLYPDLIKDGYDHLFEIASDILEWGNEKVINLHVNFITKLLEWYCYHSYEQTSRAHEIYDGR